LRLTASIAAIALVVFSGTGFLLHRSLADELAKIAHAELSGKIEVAKRFIEEASPEADLQALREHLDYVLVEHPDLRVWLRSADGKALYGGPAPRVVVEHLGEHEHLRIVRSDGIEMEAMQETLPADSAVPGANVLVGFEMRGRDVLLANYRDALVAVCAGAVLLTLALSAAAAWRGLAPVKRLSRQAAGITPQSLTTRLSVEPVESELIGLVRAFNGVLDRLEAAYRQMEAFNADVAHELRTPLSTLISGTEVMLSAPRSAAELRNTLASNLEELEQLNSVVNDMLFLARSDRGAKADTLQAADLGAQADLAVDFCEPLLEEAGLRVQRHGTASVECNPALIRRAVVNLLTNAIKHTEGGRTIRVDVESVDGRARLSLVNPGTPIPPEVAQRMFDRFYRADPAREGSNESHGLGLAIVQAIARMHDGCTFVAVEPQGNRVGIEFPVQASGVRRAALGAERAREPQMTKM
jgi:two-component system heavy metal sensor histidine kinase CusS